jgi:hypothetical protein
MAQVLTLNLEDSKTLYLYISVHVLQQMDLKTQKICELHVKIPLSPLFLTGVSSASAKWEPPTPTTFTLHCICLRLWKYKMDVIICKYTIQGEHSLITQLTVAILSLTYCWQFPRLWKQR